MYSKLISVPTKLNTPTVAKTPGYYSKIKLSFTLVTAAMAVLADTIALGGFFIAALTSAETGGSVEQSALPSMWLLVGLSLLITYAWFATFWWFANQKYKQLATQKAKYTTFDLSGKWSRSLTYLATAIGACLWPLWFLWSFLVTAHIAKGEDDLVALLFTDAFVTAITYAFLGTFIAYIFALIVEQLQPILYQNEE